MRPCGEIRAAILDAVRALATPERGPTTREIAQRANVSRAAAKATLANLIRADQIQIARARKVDHRSRGVAEYELAEPHPASAKALVDAMSTWAAAC